KFPQEYVHAPPAHGSGKDEADENEDAELFCENEYYAFYGRAEDFSYTNLFYLLICHEGNESEQTQCSDNDRDAGKGHQQDVCSSMTLIELANRVVKIRVFEQVLWICCLPFCLQQVEDFVRLFHIYP